MTIVKPQTIDLDFSARAKIVIHTKLPTSNRPVVPTVSIFHSKNRNSKQLDTLKTPLQGPGVLQQAPLPQPTTTNTPQSSPPIPKMHTISKTIEDSKVKKQRTTSISPHHSPATGTVAVPSERKIISLPSRLRTSRPSSSATPPKISEPVELASPRIIQVPIPTPSPSSQYAEEYARCPCTTRRATDKPPCDRCHLMLLADRFCELIDVQCEKWGIPPKH